MTDLSASRPRSQSLAHDIVNALSRHILQGTIPAGGRLPSESTLVREYGVSRTVVREALSRLQAAGLVETHHGRGTFALQPTDRQGLRLTLETAVSVRALLELRLGLETQAVALAAVRRNDEHLAQLREALDAFQRLADQGDSCATADRRFHLLIAEATGNPYFSDILGQLGERMIPRVRINREERGGSDLTRSAYQANLEHEVIYAALLRGDAEGARAAMWMHLSNSRERLAPEPHA